MSRGWKLTLALLAALFAAPPVLADAIQQTKGD